MPRHVAIIMDGNGRWANRKHSSRITGHRRGIEAARDIVTFSRELGIRHLTLYTFSRENWNRPAVEVNMLMDLLEKHLIAEIDSMVKNNIRFHAVGNIGELPAKVRKAIDAAEVRTRANDGMVLHLALSYSGRSEIVEACRAIARRVASGELNSEDLTEEIFEDHLYTAGVPDPDLLIRTSGESRISNFLLWQLAYTEIYVTEVLWPDFSREHLTAAIEDFGGRQRRFGLTAEQLLTMTG